MQSIQTTRQIYLWNPSKQCHLKKAVQEDAMQEEGEVMNVQSKQGLIL